MRAAARRPFPSLASKEPCAIEAERKPRPAAFTPIELLAVIAIIGILAAIIIPVVSPVRDSARSAQCVSNPRPLAGGPRLYADENRGILPPAFGPLEPNGPNRDWPTSLGPCLPSNNQRRNPAYLCTKAYYGSGFLPPSSTLCWVRICLDLPPPSRIQAARFGSRMPVRVEARAG